MNELILICYLGSLQNCLFFIVSVVSQVPFLVEVLYVIGPKVV